MARRGQGRDGRDDGTALLGRRVHHEVNSAKADVARVGNFFFHAAVVAEANEQRESEIEAACVATVRGLRVHKGLQVAAESALKLAPQRARWQSFSRRDR